MNSETISELGEWLDQNAKQIEDKSVEFDPQRVYNVIDNLEVLRKPIKEYFDMTEEDYYENESDHQLTLQKPDAKLSELKDRVLVNHIDGSLADHQVNFTYNHENPFPDGQYDAKVDVNMINYSFIVIGAVFANTIIADVRNSISRDAILSIGLAAKALDDWQK
ncbi:hypothetical protein [Companilactobacillus sp.]|jgi:hypothetical protein|uniref:hypothetical protein n=1 Tax=Companilactobacillus sp. TaxID=2767905 RepID=UPI0025C1C0EB|nr:hypothetical protein [Companilactobacillus sp.]MCH4009855.1 hypothetical protein [Companilactobacillus sp.]MCH4052469.1 hypothetical protein [Companilactobacillus sp.]MCH4077797.1 hypothetical protein [Companilactobacillus sp.]MCH4126373.1 hypothetical protein [Companilactobacillus sp.]MCI1312695.1 hypothetical protein [Companilactobacillus sp.]